METCRLKKLLLLVLWALSLLASIAFYHTLQYAQIMWYTADRTKVAAPYPMSNASNMRIHAAQAAYAADQSAHASVLVLNNAEYRHIRQVPLDKHRYERIR